MTSHPDYREAAAEDQRLGLLRALAAAPDYTANEHLLGMALDQIGHRLANDVVRSHLAWLDSRPIPLLTLFQGRVWVAVLTDRGAAVAANRAQEPGVARPRPGDAS